MPDKSLNLIPMTETWAWALTDDMLHNFWLPNQIGTGQDRLDRQELSPEEEFLFTRALAYLTTSDIQIGDNAQDGVEQALDRLGLLTEPVVRFPLGVQVCQERVHAKSYQEILETILSMSEAEQVEMYQMWQRVPEMQAKIEFANDINRTLRKACTEESISLVYAALWWYYCIYEGAWFINGFNPIFSISFYKYGLFKNTVNQLKYINRDESTHVTYGYNLLAMARRDMAPAQQAYAHELIRNYCLYSEELERDWIQFLCPKPMYVYQGVKHLQHFKFLVNKRLRETGLDELWPSVETPFDWLSHYQLQTETNFFERHVDAYQTGAVKLTWEE